LSERAASIAVGHKFDKVVEMIIKECKLELHRPIVEDLGILNELRNRIIHQGTREEIKIQQVHNYFGLLLYLVFVLGQAAEKHRIPCLDEFDFIEDFKRQLRENRKGRVTG
jgi:hypothetical protein